MLKSTRAVATSLFVTALVFAAQSAGAEPIDAGAPAPGEELFSEGPGGNNLDPDGGGIAGPGLRLESTGLEGGGNDSSGSGGFVPGCHCDVAHGTRSAPTLGAVLVLAVTVVLRRRARVDQDRPT